MDKFPRRVHAKSAGNPRADSAVKGDSKKVLSLTSGTIFSKNIHFKISWIFLLVSQNNLISFSRQLKIK